MYGYMGGSYELFVVMHPLKRTTLIHQKSFSTVNSINNWNVKKTEKTSVVEISMRPRHLLGINCLFDKIE